VALLEQWRAGLDDLQRPLPTSAMLWFCDLRLARWLFWLLLADEDGREGKRKSYLT